MSIRYLDLSGAVNFWTNIKNYILSKIPTKTSELTNDSGYLTSHQSLDNYVTLNTSQTITAIKVITGGNQGKMLFKNPDYTKGDAVESGTTISRLYFGNGASYATANGVLTTDINSAGNTSMELCAMNNTASNSNRTSLILTYDKSATRPRMLKSWGDFIPYSDNNYTLGNTSNIWKECYCNAYYLGSSAFGDIVTHNASEFLTSHQSLANYVTTNTDQDIEGNKNFKGLLTTIPSSSLWPSVSNTSDDITLLGGSVVHVEQKSSGKLTDLSGGAWNVVELGAGAFFFRNNTGTDIRYKHLYTGVVNRIPVVSGANRFINDVTPNENDTYSLGTSSLRWKACYSNAYYLGTTAFGDIVTHNASEFLTEHPSITLSSNTTSTASPAHGGTFTCIDSVTQDTNGHITKVNTKTVTLPSDNSTDTKVKQYEGTTNNERPILSRYNSTEASQTANFVVYDTGVTSNPAKHTITASGGFVGNASSASEFSDNKDVTLTGDVTGTASSKAGWSVATTLANSGVTAGTYGPSADVTGSNNATILVPEITVDAKGRVTAVTNRTYKSVNTDSDKKVYQYYKSDDNVYRLLFSNNSGNTATSNVGAVYSGLNNSFYVNPSTGSLYATKLYSGGTEVSVSGHTHTTSEITDFPTNVSAFTNDSGYLTAHPTIAINSVPVSQPSVKLQNGDTFTYVSYVNRDANGHADTIYTTTATLRANIPKSIATRTSSGTWTISGVPKGSLLYIKGYITLDPDNIYHADSYDITVIGAEMLVGRGMSDTMASAHSGNNIVSNTLGMILLVYGTGASGTRDVIIELSNGAMYNLAAYQ